MFKLPDLPYPYESLEPAVSATTMRTHHDKHHKTYVDTVNKLLSEANAPAQSLEAVVREAKGKDQKLFNNAGQAWNHAFFWHSMAPKPAKPLGQFARAIDGAFGGLAGLKEKFVAKGVGHFGSGWVWLAVENGQVVICTTHDGDTLIARDACTPILLCDLWEHAYYLDYKNDRKGFLEKWFDEVANWEFAARQFAAALGDGEPYRYPAPDGMTRDQLGQTSQIKDSGPNKDPASDRQSGGAGSAGPGNPGAVHH